MKKVILLLATTLYLVPVFCQEKSVESIKKKFTYCEIVGKYHSMGRNLTIIIDFGQSKKLLADNHYKDPSTGKPYVFNSIVDALNFMAKEGWEFVQAYSEGVVSHFILKKEAIVLDNEETQKQK
jgi:hypothetical protein